jgi:hypothetical protein
MASTDATTQPGAGWDEAQCKEALAQLERMQAQVSPCVSHLWIISHMKL